MNEPQPGDTLQITRAGKWADYGTVVKVRGNICTFTYLEKAQQTYFMKRWKENPTFLWRFDTNGAGDITYNRNVRVKE